MRIVTVQVNDLSLTQTVHDLTKLSVRREVPHNNEVDARTGNRPRDWSRGRIALTSSGPVQAARAPSEWTAGSTGGPSRKAVAKGCPTPEIPRQKRPSGSSISSAVLVGMNGLGCSFQSLAHARMSA